MKKCTWCGKEHPDDATVCVIDAQSLAQREATMSPIQRNWLLMRATRAARSSQASSRKSVQLASASVGFSNAAVRHSQAARQAQSSGSFFRWLCLHLYSKWLLSCSGWLLGRSTQFSHRARAKLQTSKMILDSLGVKAMPPEKQAE